MPAIANDYPEDIAALRDGVTTFLQRVVIPMHEKHAAVLEKKHTPEGRYTPEVLALMSEVRQESAKAGFYAACAPEAFGGAGLGYLAYFALWERIHHLCGAKYWLAGVVMSHWVKGPSPLLLGMTEQMRAQILPDLMAGKTTMCFGLSEPGAGTDAAMIKTRATQEGDGWRLNGAKIWTTNGPYADYCLVFAVTDPERAKIRRGGISAFLVPTTSPGFKVQRLIKMWGGATDEAQLAFDDVRIEPHQLVGELHNGFDLAMLGVGLGRMYNSGRAIGLSRWALEMALDYTKVRESFGKPLREYQGVTFPLAEAAMEVHAAHLVCRNAAQLLDAGHKATKELNMAKTMAVEVAARTIDRAMQTHGAMGFTNELYLTGAYQTMRNVHVADGTAEIMRRQIAKSLLAGDLDL